MQQINIGKLSCSFVGILKGELYRREFAYTEALSFADETGSSESEIESTVLVPRVYKELSGKFAIVLIRVEDSTVSDAAEVVDDLSFLVRREIAQYLFLMVVRQMIDRGNFQADFYPGNIVVLLSGRAGLVNFGAVGRVGTRDCRAVAQLLMAIGSQISQTAIAAILELFGTCLRWPCGRKGRGRVWCRWLEL